jgi:hypothetical protein
MNKLAIAFLTKDKVELSEQTVRPLIQPDRLDLWFVDGSLTEEGRAFPYKVMLEQPERELGHHMFKHGGVRGGPDAAIVYALTHMLRGNYDHVGLVEQDVLLDPGWLEPTMALFTRGASEGLTVGAVSARSYEDRILIQRDGYAVMHNLGAGMVIFSRAAAEGILLNYRTGWWPDNRRIFMQLSGLDIGKWGAFRGNEQPVTADWHFDVILASHGYASLALTPSLADMIGQPAPLEELGLRLVKEPVELLRDDKAFVLFKNLIRDINMLGWHPTPIEPFQYEPNAGCFTVFPHHLGELGASTTGWRFKWTQGFGPFSLVAQEAGASIELVCSGSVALMVGGGAAGGKVHVRDILSGYECSPTLPPERPNGPQSQILQLVVPCSGVAYRSVRLTAGAPGITFYALVTREAQPRATSSFDWTRLPPVWEERKEELQCLPLA